MNRRTMRKAADERVKQMRADAAKLLEQASKIYHCKHPGFHHAPQKFGNETHLALTCSDCGVCLQKSPHE